MYATVYAWVYKGVEMCTLGCTRCTKVYARVYKVYKGAHYGVQRCTKVYARVYKCVQRCTLWCTRCTLVVESRAIIDLICHPTTVAKDEANGLQRKLLLRPNSVRQIRKCRSRLPPTPRTTTPMPHPTQN